MGRRNHEFIRKFDKARRARKIASYTKNPFSLQSQLIDRAIQVGIRKNVIFSDDCAEWLRDLADETAHRVIAPLGRGPIAFNESVLQQIDKAFSAIGAVVEAIAFQVKSGVVLTVESMEDTFRRLCPLPPVC